MEHHDQARSGLARDAVITAAVVVLAVLALDDITTDTASSFWLERTALVGCAAWCLVIAWRLWQQHHRVFATLSFGIVGIAALAQPAIGPGTAPMQVAYVATVGALAWFLIVAGALAVFAWRPRHSHAT